MPNVVIYTRFSSHTQNEQSIEGQLKECHQFAERNEYTIIHEYVDRALSGTNDKRPEFLKMIDDSSKRQFEYVLVYQLDRFSRNRFDSATYKARLKKNGVRVLSARENISDDASGILIESVLEGMAEYYSAELSQKIKRGMDLNATKCLSTGGNVALGFCIGKDKHFEIDKHTAPIVQEIFNMYSIGKTMAEIIRYLNSVRITTSRGNEFNKNSIRRILTNKRYTGVYTYGDTEIPDGLPAIISKELFNKVQIQMLKNKEAPARSKAKVEYILTTKLFCGLCKCMMTGISGTGKSGQLYNYYACSASRKKQCNKKNVKKDYIEDLVVIETKKLLTNENISKIAKEIVSLCEKEKDNSAVQYLKKKIKENEKATENLIKALESGQVVDVIAEQIKIRKAEKIELEKQLIQESNSFPTLTVQQIKFFMERFKKGDINDIKYRKALVDTFVRKIYLYDDKMAILYNTQDGPSNLPLDEGCSSKDQLVEARGVEPLSENQSIGLSTSLAIRIYFPVRPPFCESARR